MKLAAALAPQGITLVDTPLSRTPKDAEAGTLDVMAGGDDAVFERVRPVLEKFAGRIVRTGPVGSGHTMKLLNNFVSLGYAALYSEALTLGAKAGLTPQVFDSVIRDGRMDCPFYRTFFTWVLERDPNAHRFSIANALKDLTYLSGYANASGTANPLGAAVRNSFALAAGAGRAGRLRADAVGRRRRHERRQARREIASAIRVLFFAPDHAYMHRVDIFGRSIQRPAVSRVC